MGPTEWKLKETKRGPTLYPSVGNWQQACQSHYVIYQGEVRWSDKWTTEQIAMGRRSEEQHRQTYYEAFDRKNEGIMRRGWRWLKSLFDK